MNGNRTWEELFQEEDESDNAGIFDKVSPDLEGIDLPPELEVLLKEKKDLEKELKILSGEIEPTSDDVRNQARFPIPQHTKESRIRDRKETKEEEHQQFIKTKYLEKRKIEKRCSHRLIIRNEYLKKRRLVRSIIDQRKERRSEEAFKVYQKSKIAKERLERRFSSRIKGASIERVLRKRKEEEWLEDRLLVQGEKRRERVLESLIEKQKNRKEKENQERKNEKRITSRSSVVRQDKIEERRREEQHRKLLKNRSQERQEDRSRDRFREQRKKSRLIEKRLDTR